MHGRGIHTLPDGSKYVGTFHDGTFHGHGIIFFTPSSGGGQFRGTWNLGECLGGDYIFQDGLVFSNDDWEYTTERDRRFWHEYQTFIRPAGRGGSGAVGDVEGVITPDYATTDGIPAAFADGKPQSIDAVSDDFWATAPLPRPEHEGVAAIEGTSEDMARIIANTRVGGPHTAPKNVRRPPVTVSSSDIAAAPPKKVSRNGSDMVKQQQQQQQTPSAAELEAFAAADEGAVDQRRGASAAGSREQSQPTATEEAHETGGNVLAGPSAREAENYTPVTAGHVKTAEAVIGDVVASAVETSRREEEASVHNEANAGDEDAEANGDVAAIVGGVSNQSQDAQHGYDDETEGVDHSSQQYQHGGDAEEEEEEQQEGEAAADQSSQFYTDADGNEHPVYYDEEGAAFIVDMEGHPHYLADAEGDADEDGGEEHAAGGEGEA